MNPIKPLPYDSPKTGKPFRVQTKLQAQASHENYALFTLTSMLSNLVHVNKVLDSTMILCKEIEYTIDQVKIKQRERILRDNLEKKEGKLNEIK